MFPSFLNVERRPRPRIVELEVPDEAPPFLCNLIAAAFSFVLLALIDVFSAQFLLVLFPAYEDACLLLLEFFAHAPIVDAAIGSAVLTVVAVALQLFQRFWRFPGWLPLALAWPTAWALVAPSALEYGDWSSWLFVGAVAAGFFCCHWLCVQLTREAWD